MEDPEQLPEFSGPYYWRVRAYTPKLARWSVPGEGWTFQLAETPCRILPEAAATENGILISWRVFEALGVAGFRIYRRAPDSDWLCIAPDVPFSGGECRYLDTDVAPGIRYEYTVEAFGPGGSPERFGPVSAEYSPPDGLQLVVLPNPGTGSAELTFALPVNGDVLLRVFDTTGRVVARRALPRLRAGVRHESWVVRDAAGRALSGGVYYMRIDAPAGHETRRWIVVR